MTDLFEEERRQNRMTGFDMIAQEARQFKKLQHLSNHDVAFRMATDLRSVVRFRKSRGQLTRSLKEVGIPYAVRVILGQAGIKTTGDLFAKSDKDLLALPQLGTARLQQIRTALEEFFK